jgi:hypothetical protein
MGKCKVLRQVRPGTNQTCNSMISKQGEQYGTQRRQVTQAKSKTQVGFKD